MEDGQDGVLQIPKIKTGGKNNNLVLFIWMIWEKNPVRKLDSLVWISILNSAQKQLNSLVKKIWQLENIPVRKDDNQSWKNHSDMNKQ